MIVSSQAPGIKVQQHEELFSSIFYTHSKQALSTGNFVQRRHVNYSTVLTSGIGGLVVQSVMPAMPGHHRDVLVCHRSLTETVDYSVRTMPKDVGVLS